MGADIHVYVEYKKDGKWNHLGLWLQKEDGFKFHNVYDNRDYLLFSKLAGVRGPEEPFVYPRGLPEDLSDFVKEEYAKGKNEDYDPNKENGFFNIENYYHSATWYDYVELDLLAQTPRAMVEDWDGKKYNILNLFIDRVTMLLDFYNIYVPRPGEVRVVMWFDS